MPTRERLCRFCGKPFDPDPRVGARQYACHAAECQAKRKKACQERWTEAHPGYVAEYRRTHPEAAERHRQQERQRRARQRGVDIQDESPGGSLVRILLGQDMEGAVPRVDTQDEMPLQRSILLGLIERLRASGRVDIQDQIHGVLLECYKAGRDLQTRRAHA